MSTVEFGTLEGIFQACYSRFTYYTDFATHYVAEHRASESELDGKVKDDCDGFALMCRKVCRVLGIPSRLVYCRTRRGEGHLVLEVNGWIFDNTQVRVVSRDTLDYTWISVSGYEKGDDWREIA